MGSQSDYRIGERMSKILKIKVKHQVLVTSAHRTPKRMFKFAESLKKGFGVIIAGAGGAVIGMVALTTLPFLEFNRNQKLKGLDSLLSMAQMLKDSYRLFSYRGA